MRDTTLWHFGDPETEKIHGTLADTREYAIEIIKRWMKQNNREWNHKKYGPIDSYVDCRGPIKEHDRVWEIK